MNIEKFSKSQQREIEAGQKAGVDVTIYTDTKYNWVQMREIRRGLEQGLNVREYADPRNDWLKMSEIRKGLQAQQDRMKLDSRPKNIIQKAVLDLEQDVFPAIPKEITQSVEKTIELWNNLPQDILLTSVLEQQYPEDSPVFKNKELMLDVLTETTDRALDLYFLLPENLQQDDEIIRQTIRYSQKNKSESFLDVAPENIKRNIEYIEKTLLTSYCAYNNKETLLDIFSSADPKVGKMLDYAAEGLKDDPEIVAAAVFCDPNVIKFASERIQKNPDVLIPYQKIHEQDRPVVQLNKPTGKGMER